MLLGAILILPCRPLRPTTRQGAPGDTGKSLILDLWR